MSRPSEECVVSCQGVTKTYPGSERPVLEGIDLVLRAGGWSALVGASGSGKTTLLNVIGLLDGFDGGELTVAGTDVGGLSPDRRRRIRAEYLGFVFQDALVDPKLSALENVALGLRYAGVRRADREAMAWEALRSARIDHRAAAPAATLSGGERQRVAIGRAIAHRPRVLLCDEPTGALDQETSAHIVALLREVAERGTTVLVVTHDVDLAAQCDTAHQLRHGRLIGHDA